ncbi:MAG TPA: putative Ig domain-containing protein [Candidatus Solibacter sp.]|nr:putative Ig domain-containing protein [Candidatus Solibacter sp.]
MSPNVPRNGSASTFISFSVSALACLFLVFSSQLTFAAPVPYWKQNLTVSATLPAATVGVSYNAVVSVSGGNAPYRFASQDLPSGLTLNHQTGGISGAPTAAGRFSFEVWVGDATGDSGIGQFTLTVSNKTTVSISVSPTTATVSSGATSQFTATVSNTSNTAVTWSASAGTVSSSGLFTAPTTSQNLSVTLTATSQADTTKSASATITVNATVTTSGKVQLEVLFAPTNTKSSTFKAVQTYLMSNPAVSGGNLAVEWGMIDQGPTANPQYDWSSIDSAIAPWVAAGKKVNLIVWANSDSTNATCSNGTNNTTGNCAIPAYVWKSLGSSNYVMCSTQYGDQQIPNYLNRAAFQLPYQQFMAAVIQKYGKDADIGYIRFGLGHGGETYPVTGWNGTAACGKAFSSWGVTVTSWETYLASMLNYESNLNSTKQLMVGVTPMGAPTTVVPNYVAPLAVPLHVGFGSQGLEQSDITNYPSCTANWCNLFAQFAGQAPLELQTYLQSCPDRSCTTGSLVDLVPFAVAHHATVLEIYYQDWLLAFDPSYPGYSQYGAAYAKVLTDAANTAVK